MRVPKKQKQTSAKMRKNQGIDVDFEGPVLSTNPLHDPILQRQDEFDAFEEMLSLVHEINNQLLSGEMELSEKNKNGLIGLIDLVSREAMAFQFRLNQLDQKPLQRFTHMVLRHPTLIKYFDKKKAMVDLELILEDFPDMSEGEKVLSTFMLMVWNWNGIPASMRKYPKTKPYRILSELQHLSKAELQVIIDWASDPFYVNDHKGHLIHKR